MTPRSRRLRLEIAAALAAKTAALLLIYFAFFAHPPRAFDAVARLFGGAP
jgi:hypothetical protein